MIDRGASSMATPTRRYFLTRFNGNIPDYYLAHDELGGKTLALGSWRDMKARVLVERPYAKPITESILPDAAGNFIRKFAIRDRPIALSVVWPEEMTRDAKLRTRIVNFALRDGQLLRVEFREVGGDTIRLSLGNNAHPELSRELQANYDRLKFTIVMHRHLLEFRAESIVGATPVFSESINLREVSAADIVQISGLGLPAAELTIEE